MSQDLTHLHTLFWFFLHNLQNEVLCVIRDIHVLWKIYVVLDLK
jgi:hypothetical protein